MAGTNEKVGRMACLTCGRPVLVKRTGTGKLCYRCDECASSAFTEPGDEGADLWAARMTPIKTAAQAPAPAGAPKPAPTKPAPTGPVGGFSLGL